MPTVNRRDIRKQMLDLDITDGLYGTATAGNDMTLYVADGAVASTARNEVAYVAMEGTNSPVVVGAIQTGTYDQWFSGSILLTLVVAAALSTAQLTSIKNLVNAYFGLSL